MPNTSHSRAALLPLACRAIRVAMKKLVPIESRSKPVNSGIQQLLKTSEARNSQPAAAVCDQRAMTKNPSNASGKKTRTNCAVVNSVACAAARPG